MNINILEGKNIITNYKEPKFDYLDKNMNIIDWDYCVLGENITYKIKKESKSILVEKSNILKNIHTGQICISENDYYELYKYVD